MIYRTAPFLPVNCIFIHVHPLTYIHMKTSQQPFAQHINAKNY